MLDVLQCVYDIIIYASSVRTCVCVCVCVYRNVICTERPDANSRRLRAADVRRSTRTTIRAPYAGRWINIAFYTHRRTQSLVTHALNRLHFDTKIINNCPNTYVVQLIAVSKTVNNENIKFTDLFAKITKFYAKGATPK